MRQPTRHRLTTAATKRPSTRSLIVPEVVPPTPVQPKVVEPAEPRPATALTEAELQEIINAAYN